MPSRSIVATCQVGQNRGSAARFLNTRPSLNERSRISGRSNQANHAELIRALRLAAPAKRLNRDAIYAEIKKKSCGTPLRLVGSEDGSTGMRPSSSASYVASNAVAPVRPPVSLNGEPRFAHVRSYVAERDRQGPRPSLVIVNSTLESSSPRAAGEDRYRTAPTH